MKLIAYIDEQRAAATVLPDDRTIVVERIKDELGVWRVCILSPHGGRVFAPWTLAMTAIIENERDIGTTTSSGGMTWSKSRIAGDTSFSNSKILLGSSAASARTEPA